MISPHHRLIRGFGMHWLLIGLVSCQSSKDGSDAASSGGASNSGGRGAQGGSQNASSGGAAQGGSAQGGGAQGGTVAHGGTLAQGGAAQGGSARGGGGAGGTGATAGIAVVGSGGSGRGGSAGANTGGGSGSGDLMNPAPGSKAFIGVNFWRIDWEGSADFFLSNTDWATVKNPWQPQLLADLAPFSVLRFMDWNLTNDDPNPQATWSTRKLPTQAQTGEPIAFEWQIDLCNRALKDCWITLPIQADERFQQSLAQLVHDKLDARLRLYIEYSNEVWNGSFKQSKIALDRANQLNLPVVANPCCTTDTIKTGNAYVYGAVRMFEQFEKIFGKDSPRLVKVLSGQSAWDGPCQVHMEALNNPSLNPNRTLPTVYAIAPYFGGTSSSALQKEIPNAASGVKAHVTCAAKQGLSVIGYEGGSDSYAAGNGCVTLQHDAAMYDLYGQYLDALVAAGMKGPIMQYTEVGACWGLKEKTSDTLASSPKYRAVADWVAAHP